MLIYGESGIFAHKETIKQFIQLMIEQVWRRGGGGGGGGWMCQKDVPLFCVSFSELLSIFLCRFFNSPMPIFGSILLIFAYFWLYIMRISSKGQTVFWAQNSRNVQLIPNFLRYPACF